MLGAMPSKSKRASCYLPADNRFATRARSMKAIVPYARAVPPLSVELDRFMDRHKRCRVWQTLTMEMTRQNVAQSEQLRANAQRLWQELLAVYASPPAVATSQQ